MRKRQYVRRLVCFCAGSAGLLGPWVLGANSATWSGGGSTAAWDQEQIVGLNLVYVNWGNATFNPGSNTDVTFANTFVSGNPFLNGNRTVHSVMINSTVNYSITGATGNIFTFPTLTRSSTSSGTQTFSTQVNLNGNTSWSIDGSGAVVMGGSVGEAIAGSALTKTGAGQVTLGTGTTDTTANTWTGMTIVFGGILQLNKAAGTNAIASSGILINGGTLQLNNSNQINNSAAVELDSGTFDLNGYAETIGGFKSTGGTIATGAPAGELYVNQSTNTSINSSFTGSGMLAKQGTGTLSVNSSGSNALGGFEEDAGVLNVTGSYNLVGGTILAVNGGTMNINNSSTITISGAAGTVYADSGGTLNINGAHTTVNLPFQSFAGIGGNGTVNINAATVNIGTFLGASFASGSTGTLTIKNGAQVNVPNLFAGAQTGSTGTITISDPGTVVTNTNYVGIGGSDSSAADVGGTGTINVSNSASLTTPFLNFYSNLAVLNVDKGTVSVGTVQVFTPGVGNIRISDGAASALSLGTNNDTFTYSGMISDYTDGSGSLTKAGGGTLTLANNNNSFTGPVYINGGSIVVSTVATAGNPCPLGAGSEIAFNGGALEVTSQTPSFSDRSVVLGPLGGTIQVDSSLLVGDVSCNSSTLGPFTKMGYGSLITSSISAGVVNVNTGSLTNDGALTATSMTVGFGATADLGAPSTVTGSVSVAGTLTLDSSLSIDQLTNTGTIKMDNPFGSLTLGTGDSSFTFAGVIQGAASATLTKAGSGTVAFTGANSYLGPTTISAGTLVLDNSLTTPGAAVTILSAATLQASGFLQRQILGTGSMVADGPLFVGSLSGSGYAFAGTLNVGGYSVQLLSASPANLGVQTTLSDGGQLTSISGLAVPTSNTLTSSGNATITGVLVNSGTVSAGKGLSDSLTFTDNASGAGGFSGNLHFQKGFAPTGSVSAALLWLDSTSVAQLSPTTFLITASIVNNGQFLQGGGSALINGSISGTGGISISAGTLSANSIAQTALQVEGGMVSVAKHSIGGGTSILQAIQISGSGNLDLADEDLIIDYQGASPIAQIAKYLGSGEANGAWDGPGINSTAAGHRLGTALGYGESAALGVDSFGGIIVDDTAVLIGYTWDGDTNLDGVVNSTDLAKMSLGGNSWMQGDFNYDGKVDGDDYSLFALGAAVSQGANISTILPEPAALSVAGIAVCLGLRRRKQCA